MSAPPPIQLASLGMADSLILMILALVVFGPRRLPQIGRQIGKLMYEFRKASNDFKFQMEEELRISEENDRRKKEEAERAALLTASTHTLTAPGDTIEAQADIGAVEQASVSGQAAVYSAASTYPEQYPPGTVPAAEAATESTVTLPRTTPVIQPPSTGEPIPAARPGTNLSSSAEPPAEASAGHTPDPSSEEPKQTEPVNQHG